MTKAKFSKIVIVRARAAIKYMVGPHSPELALMNKRDAIALCDFAEKHLDKAEEVDRMREALEQCAEYFEPRVDVNWEGDGPNTEASLLNEINYALGKTP